MFPTLVLAVLVAAPVPDTALLELRVFEAHAAKDTSPAALSLPLGTLDTFELDRELMRLEQEGSEGTVAGLEGLRQVRIVSAPKIVTRMGEPAEITSGSEGEAPTLRARALWSPAGEDRFVADLDLLVCGVALRGQADLGPGESWLLAWSDGKRWLAVVATLRPLR